MYKIPTERNRRVLVIDDNRSIHDDFRKILAPDTAAAEALDASEASVFGPATDVVSQKQFEVDSAYQGQEGAIRVQKALDAGQPYAMAFVDVRMPPGWDGVETSLKLWEIDADLQVVLCTAYSDYSWGELFEKLGRRDGLLILKKPFDAVEAFQLAHALTEKWWLHKESRRKMGGLEQQVAGRTSELLSANQTLQAEVAQHQRAEESLRQSDEKFHQLSDNITDAFWIRSPDMRELHYISPAFQLIWGRSIECLTGDPAQWTEFILPEDRERVLAAFTKLKGAASNVDIEYRIVRPSAEVRWVRVRGFQVRDSTDKLIRLIGIVTDITDRHLAAEELRESERRFSDMLRNLELISVMTDRTGVITYCNDHLLWLTDWTRKAVIGENWLKLFVPPELSDELRGVHSALIENRPEAWRHENEILTRSGKRRLIRWNNSVLRSNTGDIIGTASIGEDITDRRRLETQLFQSQKMETVGKLAGGIAHEFNSIMTAIIGQSEMLLSELLPQNPLRHKAMEIRVAAERASILTRQLLAYGRKQLLRPEILDLNVVLTGMENALRHVIGSKSNLITIPQSGIHAIKADFGQIEQVIMNIAMNAADAMPNGGKLILETANVILDKDYVHGLPDMKSGNYVMLAITDTGTGMNEDVKSRAFEPFFSTKSIGEGTGLGLSTSYGIIKQSGGQITVYSEPGKGATFKIYLPEVEREEKIFVQRENSPLLPRGTETVLLVEDDPALREMAATLLRQLGYKVLVAQDGIEALNLVKQAEIESIDIMFIDLVMPQMGGKELAERVAILYPRIRTLFTSGYTENSITHQGILNSNVAFLQKPFTPSELAQKLRKTLAIPIKLEMNIANQIPVPERI